MCCAVDCDSLSSAPGSPASSSPEFFLESASDVPESGVTYPHLRRQRRPHACPRPYLGAAPLEGMVGVFKRDHGVGDNEVGTVLVGLGPRC